MTNKPYTFETAADANLFLVIKELRGQTLNAENIIRAELALERAINERLSIAGVQAKINIEAVGGRNIKITGYDSQKGDDPNDRTDSYYGEVEV